jgi:phosphinothricin acetyltransferase
MSLTVREARPGDLPAITAIYAHHVLHGTGTFEETPPPDSEMAARMDKVRAAGCPWLVAEDAAGLVIGFGYFAPFRDRSAYRFTVEDSVYVRDDIRGQGVGKALVAELIARAEARGLRQMIAVIGDSENVGSIGLHISLGFRQAGVLRAAGMKFGRWVDVVTMQRPLGEGEKTLPQE